MSVDQVRIFTDGGSRGNPGPGALGAVITDAGDNVLQEISRYLGHVTNNQAEYQALIAALEAAQRLHPQAVFVYMDSELVVHQLNGRYKVRHPNMLPLHTRVRELAATFPSITFTHVRREQNHHADRLVNAAIDRALAEGKK